MSRPSTPAAPGSPYALFGPSVLAEKLRILRTLRALDRVGVDPMKFTAIREPLVRLAEVDQLLTTVLEVLERDGCREPEAAGSPYPTLLQISEATRGDVADRLPPRDRKAFDRATGEVAALEAEVWMQVDDFRAHAAAAPRTSKAGRASAAPMTDAEARRAAEKAWTPGKRLPRPEGHEKVAVAERSPLPPGDAPLVAWFERLPAPWLQGLAIVHDLPAAGAEPLAARLAARLADRAWLERLLAERLGASEREKLAMLLRTTPVPLGSASDPASKAFEVAWDWTRGLPAHVGAKLRAFGLAHVGTWEGSRVAAIPPPLIGPLTALLAAVDPDAADAPTRALGDLLATRSMGAPFADPELARWKAVDKSLGAVFESWLDKGAITERAVIPFFGPGPRELATDAQRQGFCEYVLFDWRAAPGQSTVGERALTTTKFASPEHEAIAAATVAARPAVYRIEKVDPGVAVEAVPVFPAGPGVRVTDRAFAHSAQVGIWVPMRVYAAGPYHFFRLAGDPIPRADQPALEKALRRATRGADPAAWIAEDPAAFFRTLRAHAH